MRERPLFLIAGGFALTGSEVFAIGLIIPGLIIGAIGFSSANDRSGVMHGAIGLGLNTFAAVGAALALLYVVVNA